MAVALCNLINNPKTWEMALGWHGSNVAEEIRNAVDAYLAGVTSDEFALLDAATKNTEALLAAMSEMLDDVNQKAERVFAEMTGLRGGGPESLPE